MNSTIPVMITSTNSNRFHSLKKFFHLSVNSKHFLPILALIIFLIDLIMKLSSPFLSPFKTKDPLYIVSLICPPLSSILFTFSERKLLTHKSKRIESKSYLSLHIMACLILSAGIVIGQYYFTFSALQSSESEIWTHALSYCSESMFVFFLVILIMPIGYLRILIPFCYYLGICIAYIKIGYESLGWIIMRYILSLAFCGSLLYIYSRLRLKEFLEETEVKEWNKVYRIILDRNPSCITVMNGAGQFIYNNAAYQQLTLNHKEKALLYQIKGLKLRDFGGQGSKLLSVHSQNSPLSPRKSSSRFVNNSRRRTATRGDTRSANTVAGFENLSELLEFYRGLLNQRSLSREDNLVFDGKLNSRRSTLLARQRSKAAEGEAEKGKNKDKDSPRQNMRSSMRGAFSFEVILRPVPEYNKIIIILNDTTERDLVANLENNSEYKDKVLASVSHELRTPLNGNLGFLQAAIDAKNIPADIKNNFLLPAWKAGKILGHVIDDILDYSESHSDGLTLNPTTKPLLESINYCYELYSEAFRAKGLQLKVKLDENLPVQFNTDHKRLVQVILNLLSNALKFTFSGHVKMKLSPAEKHKVCIKIVDTGVGIEADDIPRLFEERLFVKNMTEKGLQSQGVGMGLKISHRIAQILGDYNEEGIQVKSIRGRGSKFSFEIQDKTYEGSINDISELLLDPSQEPKAAGGANISCELFTESFVTQGSVPVERLFRIGPDSPTFPSSKGYLKKKKTLKDVGNQDTARSEIRGLVEEKREPLKVLVVDDDPLNILVLKSLLEQFGVKCDSAVNGEKAVSKVVNEPSGYGLIIMDCQMPIMDGFEATRELVDLMSREKLPLIPIVGCTAFNAQDKLDECIKCGMQEVLEKPVVKVKLRDVLKKYHILQNDYPFSISN